MERTWGEEELQPVRVTNPNGASQYVLVCDHASNHVPPAYNSLGLAPDELERHIAWDPGAAAVCLLMAKKLDATLVESGVSRLVIDCNRPLHAPDLIASVSERTVIPGNASISREEKARRVALAHEPYHAALESLVESRIAAGRETRLIAVHSFTPVYAGVPRPWQAGVIHDEDERLSRPLLAALRASGGVSVGDNQPYSPKDLVYFTLERHARSRRLPCVMIEIRNDEIAGHDGQRQWAERLARMLLEVEVAYDSNEVSA